MWHINRRVGYITKGIGFMMFTGIATTGTDGYATVYFPKPLRRIRPVHIVPITTSFVYLFVTTITTTYFVVRSISISSTTDGDHSHSTDSTGSHTHSVTILSAGSHIHPSVTFSIGDHTHSSSGPSRTEVLYRVLAYSSGYYCVCNCSYVVTGIYITSMESLTVSHAIHNHTALSVSHSHYNVPPSGGYHDHSVSIIPATVYHTHYVYYSGTHSHRLSFVSTSIPFLYFVIY